MSGIESPVAIVGIVGAAFNITLQCIRAFVLLRSAWSADRNIATVRLMISCEQRELEYWAEAVGLLDEIPTLRVALKDLVYIQPVLIRLHTLLTDLKEIRSEFGLELHGTNEELELTRIDMVDLLPQAFQHQVRRQRLDDQAWNGSRPIWQKLKWVVVDEARVRKYLEALQYFVKQLKQYLDRAQSAALNDRIELMHRTQVADSTDRSFLLWKMQKGEGKDSTLAQTAVGAAADLRQKGLALELLPGIRTSETFSQTSPTESHSTHTIIQQVSPVKLHLTTQTARNPSMKVSKSQLRVKDFKLGTHRQLGYLDSTLVLIEWRMVEHGQFRQMETRVNTTSHFLKGLIDNSFRSLPCIGYVEDVERRRYGYILRVLVADTLVPPYIHSGSKAKYPEFPVEVASLREFIDMKLSPTLNERLYLAITLLNTVLQLHTSGWLHKALHPDNILSFVPPGSITRDDTFSVKQGLNFFLSGYTYARADEATEITEPSLAQVYAQIYRHPDSIGQSRVRYRRSFDVFSMGCILIEIGLWSSLISILEEQPLPQSCNTKQITSLEMAIRVMTAKSKFLESLKVLNRDGEEHHHARRIFDRLKAAVGEAYANIVLTCLRASELDASQNSINETECILGLEQNVIQQLRRICENV